MRLRTLLPLSPSFRAAKAEAVLFANNQSKPSRSYHQPFPSPRNLRSVLRPLPTKKSQPPFLRLERNHAALWEKEHVALCRLDTLPTLIRYFKIAVHNDLHLVIGIGVDERGARLEAVEAGGYWVFGATAVEEKGCRISL